MTEASNGIDLLISDATSGDIITITYFYEFSGAAVESLVYGDGTTVSLVNSVKETAADGTSTLNGTNGDDTLIGGTGTMKLFADNYGSSDGNDTLVAGVGNTTAEGGTGNNVYSYAPSDGLFKIIDVGGTDTLKLGA